MRKILFIVLTFSIMLTMSCKGDVEDLFEGDNPLIGTWDSGIDQYVFIDDSTVHFITPILNRDDIYTYEFDRTPNLGSMKITVFIKESSGKIVNYYLGYNLSDKKIYNGQNNEIYTKIKK